MGLKLCGEQRRAARCAAPTGWNDFLMAGDRKGRPYGFIGALPEIWRAGEDTRPYDFFCNIQKRRVQEAAPYSSAPAATCSAKPGAEVEPHQPQFFTTPGPSGPD